MKYIMILCTSAIIAGACSSCDHKSMTTPANASAHHATALFQSGPAAIPAASYSQPVSINDANRMIKSYLNGIDYTRNTNEIRSWIFNADTLRQYLSSGAGADIRYLKLMLAHSMEYIISGNEGKRPPANSHALTVVIVGVDNENDYIYNAEGDAYEYCMPCPPECLPQGDAAKDTLQ